jgi:hypothetical protein
MLVFKDNIKPNKINRVFIISHVSLNLLTFNKDNIIDNIKS